MMFSFLAVAAIAATSVLAAPKPSPNLAKRCVNSASDRSCWGDYDLTTDYYNVVPDTGVTREYWFDMQNGTAALDGVERIVLTINGSFPGPTIIADWGDTVVVHVTNSMQDNGTSLHFHGIRQHQTNEMDGVGSITQCPTAPGGSITYTWRASQYGSSWYHSHFSVQAWNGIAGGIIINGPATANYDEDLGTVMLSDWTHQTADVMALEAAVIRPLYLDNCLINGTNVYDDAGSRFETTFVAGTRYRIRLVNGAADTHFRFAIDNHTIEVIQTDFVPIVPYNTTAISIGMGQRYDIIVTANQATDNYWMRAIPQQACSSNYNVDNILGIVRYDTTSTADPTSTADEAAAVDSCADEAIASLVPYLVADVSSTYTAEDTEAVTVVNGATIVWEMGGVAFLSQWSYPTIQQVLDGNDTWSSDQHVIQLPNADETMYFVITTTFAQAHPIHLHGHDFWILAQGSGVYTEGTTPLTTVNAPRRDVAMLPGAGYLVLAYVTDNPGAWLMHCHIAWHVAEGFALQLLERESEIPALVDSATISDTCAKWDAYVATDDIVQADSGV